ncbi:MAG: hypothetical protein DCC49_00635 [Acidobacteria bacterium]|nr:MAG: hypothetical protein DCC49_00635 [Acidobacteriota bacterium]
MPEPAHSRTGRSVARTHPTKAGIVALAYGGFFFLIGSNVASGWILLISALCFALPLLSFLRSFAGVRGVEVSRAPVSRGQVGTEMRYELSIRARRAGLSQLVVRDRCTSARPVVLYSLAKGETALATVTALPVQRGWFEDPPLIVECAAPLGLWSTRRQVPCTGSVEIAPAMPPIRVPWHMGGNDPLAEGLTEPPRRGAGLDFMGLREYQPGDPVRHIHWPSSARRDEPVVREYQQEGVRPIVVIPDLTHSGAVTERIISVSGAIVRDAITRSIPVYLRLSDGRLLESPNSGLLASELARITTGVQWPDVAEILRGRRLPPNPLVVAVSDRLPGNLGPQGAIVAIGGVPPFASPYPAWSCPQEGEAWLTALSTPSAA